MTKIFKQLGRHWAACLAVVALLIVQAYCDLSLPDYTSKIVDTGIQQGGIESPVPDTVRSTTLQALELLMSEDDAALADEAYSDPDADGVRTLNPDADPAALENAFTTPDVVLYMAAAKNAATAAGTTDTVAPTAYDLDAVATQLAAASQAPGAREMLQSQLTDGLAQLDETVADSLSSQAMLLVALEYDAQGIAHDVQMSYLLRTGGQMLALTLLMVAVAVAVGFIASRVSAAIGRDLRRDVFRTVVGYSNAEIEKFSTASLITRTTNDIQQVQFVCVILLRMVAYAPILGIGGIMHVASGNTGLEWIIFVAVAALLALIAVLMNVAMPKFKQMQVLVDRLNLVSREILTGIMPVRAFSREKFEEERFDKANTDLMSTQLFTNRAMAFMMPLMNTIMNGLMLAVYWIGAYLIDAADAVDKLTTFSNMVVFSSYSIQVIMSFLLLSMVFVLWPRADVSAQRVLEVIDTEPMVTDGTQDAGKPGEEGEIEFRNVSFAYPDSRQAMLEGVNFKAKKGQTVAFIGSTGSGKSSLINLVPRFYDATQGEVLVDGVNVRDYKLKALRDKIGYVPQQSFLFKGTIASNVAYGDTDRDDDTVRRACDVAQATEFIDKKQKKYDSGISQGGSNVSGGQKQRLSIARAVYRHPEILIFDDSFSALDFKTDRAVRDALEKEAKDSTKLIVAQRIGTIMNADRIIVLDDGKVVGQGTHEELLDTCEVYRQIAESQLSEDELKR